MDIATLIGLIAGTIIILLAALADSEITVFLNVPGIAVVLGGTLSATLIKFPIKDCFRAFSFGVRQSFFEQTERPSDLIDQINNLVHIARVKNILALEDEEISNPMLKQGVQLCVDGVDRDFIINLLNNETQVELEYHEKGEKVFRAMGESAPAFGMVGTLVGLVQMLTNLSDSEAIGPAMAVALLTTLYGALFANLIALPIADKLQIRSEEERINKSIIFTGVIGLKDETQPRILSDMLETFIPHKKFTAVDVVKSTNKETDDMQDRR